MAQSGVALKQSFSAPSETVTKPFVRTQILNAEDRDDEFEEDLDAINLAVEELIRLDARGQRLNIEVEDVQTSEALELIAERFREFGLSNSFSETIISAIEECAVVNGTSFARKNKANLMSVRLQLTDKKPELKKGRSHFMIAFDGKKKLGASFSDVQMHYTASGTKMTTTNTPDLENMFVDQTKYLIFAYEGLDGEDLSSPENAQADMVAVAAVGADGGGMPDAAMEEQQSAIDSGMEIPELIELVAENGIVEPEQIEFVAENDNAAPEAAPELSPDEVMAVLDQAGMVEAMPIDLTSDQQAALQEFVEQADLPEATQEKLLQQISEGTIDRATFEQIESVVADHAQAPELQSAMSEIRDIVAVQDKILPVLAEQKIFLTPDQQQSLQEMISGQELPANVAKKIIEQVEARAVSVETIAILDGLSDKTPPVLDVLVADAKHMIQDQQGQMNVPVHVPLTPMVKESVIEAVSTMDIPASAKADYTAQVQNETPTRAVVNVVSALAVATPAINAFKDQSATQFRREDRAVVAGKVEDYSRALPNNAPIAVKTALQNIVTDLKGGQSLTAAQQMKLAIIAPSLAQNVRGIQTFNAPVRDPIALVNEIKAIHQEMSKTSPREAAALASVIASVTANPAQAEKTITEFIQNLPDDSKVYSKLTSTTEQVRNTSSEFTPKDGQREAVVQTLEKAKADMPPESRAAIDKIVHNVQLGNPVSRAELDTVVAAAPETLEVLSDSLEAKKPEVTQLTGICGRICPHGGNCENCGMAFGASATLEPLKTRKLDTGAPAPSRS
jgi:hypothetical protein